MKENYLTGVNDRISFKKFLSLSFDKPSPFRAGGPSRPEVDHSRFSRFRSRLSKKAMIHINNIVLQEFEKRRLSINEGKAVDARLVKSASTPISSDKPRKLNRKRHTPENRLDKNGNPLKFSTDIESDWTIKIDTPLYGLKEHASVDVKSGFILATTFSPASVHDTNYLPYLTLASCHTKEPIGKVYADKGYYGRPNGQFLNLNNMQETV